MTKTQSDMPARPLGHELATELQTLTELSNEEVDSVAGARMANTWSAGCGGRCSELDD